MHLLVAGKFVGGEGVQRELLFRKPVTVSVLTERRVLRPYGMNGGEPGKRGENYLIKANGKRIFLGGKTAVTMDTGDAFSMLTPGGGGYGVVDDVPVVLPEGSVEPTFYERGTLAEFRSQQEQV